jgi:hypothetical protein
MEAFASFFRSLKKNAQSKYYALIPEILNILPPIKESGDGEMLTKALVALIDLAEVAPKMFKPLFNSVVQFSVSVIQDKELDDTPRQNALELMATFADCAPQMCRKDPSFTNDMVTQCLSLMTDVGIDDDDATEWNESEDVSASVAGLVVKLTPRSLTRMRATQTTLLVSNVWTVLQTSLAAQPSSLPPSTGCHG